MNGARSLGVTVVGRIVVIIVIFPVVVFVFLFFLVWLLANEDISSYRPIRRG